MVFMLLPEYHLLFCGGMASAQPRQCVCGQWQSVSISKLDSSHQSVLLRVKCLYRLTNFLICLTPAISFIRLIS